MMERLCDSGVPLYVSVVNLVSFIERRQMVGDKLTDSAVTGANEHQIDDRALSRCLSK